MSRVALNHAGSSVAPWAQHASAQAALIEASSAIYFDRAAAKKDFLLAVDGFNAVLGQTNENETLLRKRAQFGLGQAYEGLNELEKAIDSYKVLAEASDDGKLAAQDRSDSAIVKQANRRLKSLQDPQTKEFYNWFFAQEPPAPKWPAAGDAPGLPFGQLPSEPNITLPTFPQSNDLDIDFEIPLDDTAESSDTGIFDTLDTDAAETLDLDAAETLDFDTPETLDLDAPETLELDAPETSDAGADETALDNDTAGSGADTEGAEDSNEN